MLAKWNGKLIAVSICIKKGRLCSRAKSTWKSEFHPYAVISAKVQRSVMPSKDLTLSSINKDQLKDL